MDDKDEENYRKHEKLLTMEQTYEIAVKQNKLNYIVRLNAIIEQLRVDGKIFLN